jgi:hypothetical protein
VTTLQTAVSVSPESDHLRDLAHERGLASGVSERVLLTQLLLHLPRVADATGCVDPDQASEEANRLAPLLRRRCGELAEWALPPEGGVGSAPALRLTDVDEEVARLVLERFHYLGSFRPQSRHFAGVCGAPGEAQLAALFTVSPLDLSSLAATLPGGVKPTEVAVLARVFSFDWAPENSLSYLMGRLFRRLRRERPNLRMLLTYLNPNLGFTGASYRASNWTLVGREVGTRYAYLDGCYVTDRALGARFGTSDPEPLREALGGRIEFSAMELQPLEVWAYPLDPTLRGELSEREPSVIHRPSP